jgi:hypothetical protein
MPMSPDNARMPYPNPMAFRPGALTAMGGSGYRMPIPSPQQGPAVDPRAAAIMARLAAEAEMAPMGEDGMQYNRPQMDVNDAVFGDVDPAEFIRRLLGGR